MNQPLYTHNTRLGSVQMCAMCHKLIKRYNQYTGKYEDNLDLYNHDRSLGGPIIEKVWTQPHTCVLSVIKIVEKLFFKKWITLECYNRWMELNTGPYQIGASDKILSLWNDRKLALDDIEAPVLSEDLLTMIKDLKQLTRVVTVYKCNKRVNHYHVKIIWPAVNNRGSVKILNKLFPFSSDADKSHTNVDFATIIYRVSRISNKEDRVKFIDKINKCMTLLPLGTANITMVAWAISSTGLEPWDKLYEICKKDNMCGAGLKHYQAYFKAITTAIRRTSRWPNGDHASIDELVSCAYFELPVGRSINVSDWEAEINKRTHVAMPLKLPHITTPPSKATNDEYIAALYTQLYKMMTQLVTKSDTWPDWRKFVECRQNWAASGSSGGQHIIINGKRERINKQAYFEKVTANEMESWLYSKPLVEAVASEKFEMGKGRAIYGTKPQEYAIMSYVIGQLEKRLWRVDGVESGLQGYDEVVCINRRSKTAAIPNIQCSMIDFADFNVQHTLEAQSIVFKALHDRLVEIGAEPDVIKAAKWCYEALLNQTCIFPGDKKARQIIQGMFSGCRGTHFLNTLLNVGYKKVAEEWVLTYLDLQAINELAIHQGDDVWNSNESRVWAAALYCSMQSSGLVFQASKQMFDVQRGEYLRVVYHGNETRGYPLRAIGSLVINPLQSTEINSPIEKASGLNSQIHLLFRRGISKAVCDMLYQAIVPHALTTKMPDGGGLAVPSYAVSLAATRGGLDLGPPLTSGGLGQSIAQLPKFAPCADVLADVIPTNMSEDWIKVVSEAIKINIDTAAIKRVLHYSNVSGSLRTIDKQEGLLAYKRALKAWIKVFKGHKMCPRTDLLLILSDQIMSDVRVSTYLEALGTLSHVKSGWQERGPIEKVLAAVANGPFKDLATVQAGFNLGIIEAVYCAISWCNDARQREDALAVLDDIERHCTKDILARIISGIGGMERSWEAVLTPIILSWASKTAANLAIYAAVSDCIKTTSDWDKILETKQQLVMRMIVDDGNLIGLSKF